MSETHTYPKVMLLW